MLVPDAAGDSGEDYVPPLPSEQAFLGCLPRRTVFCVLEHARAADWPTAMRSVESFILQKRIPEAACRLLIVNWSGQPLLSADTFVGAVPHNVFEFGFDPDRAPEPGRLLNEVLAPLTEPTWLARWRYDHYYHDYRLASQLPQLQPGVECSMLRGEIRVDYRRSLAVMHAAADGQPASAVLRHAPGAEFVPSGSWDERIARILPIRRRVLDNVPAEAEVRDRRSPVRTEPLLDVGFWHERREESREDFFGVLAGDAHNRGVGLPGYALEWLGHVLPHYGLERRETADASPPGRGGA